MLTLIKLLHENLAPKRYFAILGATICLTVVAPLVEHDGWSRLLLGAVVVINLIIASFVITAPDHKRIRSILLAALTGTMWTLNAVFNFAPFNSVWFEFATSGVCLMFFVHTIYVMLQDILSGSITGNRLCGAVCVYVMIGFCFVMLHTMVALVDPGAYSELTKHGGRELLSNVSLAERYPPFLYFSFSTLSSLGYGDIVPIGHMARTLSWVQAVVGQFYMAIMVARLVGLHIASAAFTQGQESSRDLQTSFLAANDADKASREPVDFSVPPPITRAVSAVGAKE